MGTRSDPDSGLENKVPSRARWRNPVAARPVPHHPPPVPCLPPPSSSSSHDPVPILLLLPHGTPITDNSILLQLDSGFSDCGNAERIPLQLLDQPEHTDSRADSNQDWDKEEFRILRYTMHLKRRKDVELSSPRPPVLVFLRPNSGCSSSASTSKQGLVQMQARRAAVRAWANQPLSAADADVWGIMENRRSDSSVVLS